MRLVTFYAGNLVKLGVSAGDAIIDVNAAAASAGLRGPGNLAEALQSYDGLSQIARIASAVKGKSGPWMLAGSGVKLVPPVPSTAKILGIALNYHDACKRGGFSIPSTPKVFSKLPTTLIGPEDPIELPAGRNVTWEGELAVVIGRRAKNVAASDAWDYIADIRS